MTRSASPPPAARRPGLLRRLLAFVFTWRFAVMAGLFVAGILFWGAFNTAMEWTNREAFCISCHEMNDNVYREYRNTIHYQNRTGVRATCPDCHVPKDWTHKIIRKIQASNELWHHVLGSIDTPEKFNAKRAELASHEWARMKATDSRECRNCHSFDFMDFAEQDARSGRQHQVAIADGQTCIDCHKGIAHTLPPIEQHIGAPKANPADLGKPELPEPAVREQPPGAEGN
jgi:cytochrome c-type protein NapC